MKTLLIVGAGAGLGLSIARRFGEEGYCIGLISRNPANLERLVERLGALGIEGAGFPGDVTDDLSLERAVRAAEGRFGRIDVLEFSPMPGVDTTKHIRDTTRGDLQHQFEYSILAAVTAVRAVLPGMLDRRDGAVLFTTGASSIVPLPSHGSGSCGQAALRNYAYNLNEAFRDDGIYSGTITVANIIVPGGEADPSRIAALYWDMCAKRDRVEEVVGDPSLLTGLERAQGKKIMRAEMDAALAARNAGAAALS